MPDITMCANKTCIQKTTCYRYRAIPSGHRQSWFNPGPISFGDDCEYFLDVGNRTDLRTLEKIEAKNDTE